jgi:signal transduction histidine kinase
MKTMKLLTHTSRSYLLIISILLVLFFGVFYFIMRMQVQQNIDEILSNRKNNIVETFKNKGGVIPTDVFGYTDFSIAPIKELYNEDVFSDTLIFEKTDEELDEYRKLVTSFEFSGSKYKLEIVKAHLEAVEIINTGVISLSLIFLMMAGVFYFSSRYFSLRLWKPFHETLVRLKSFEADRSEKMRFNDTRIAEFDELNKSITELTERVQNTFVSQKQFIENASHEMQTPLAVLQNQLEMLIGDPNLTDSQSEKIKMLLDSTQRLSKLNKTLQLLSKIENQQFIETEKNDVKSLVDKILTYFEGQQENLQIDVSFETKNNFQVSANQALLDALLTNLIKNAFLHNIRGGKISIKIEQSLFEITNTSSLQAIPKDKLFQRFFKQSQNKESWGLGLAIVKKICDVNHWDLSYSAHSGMHSFNVKFP